MFSWLAVNPSSFFYLCCWIHISYLCGHNLMRLKSEDAVLQSSLFSIVLLRMWQLPVVWRLYWQYLSVYTDVYWRVFTHLCENTIWRVRDIVQLLLLQKTPMWVQGYTGIPVRGRMSRYIWWESRFWINTSCLVCTFLSESPTNIYLNSYILFCTFSSLLFVFHWIF